MSRFLVLLAALVVLAACGVPEVDLELPDRPRAQEGVSQATPDDPSPADGPAVVPSTPEQGGDPPSSTGPPDPDDLDELEQLVSEIEALLEGVSDELDQITFEEEGE